jgi:hypothetical protein
MTIVTNLRRTKKGMVEISSMDHIGHITNGRNYLLSNVEKYSRLGEKQNKKKAIQRSETIPKNRISELNNRDASVPGEYQS